MNPPYTVVHDEWNAYQTMADEAPLFVSFDEAVTRDEPPSELLHCARVLIPIAAPNDAGGPVSPEAERLWELEDELCELLEEHEVVCRMVGRLTCAGTRELVFQLADWDAFRPAVGIWIIQHEEYEIDVSEHEGWEFFDEVIRPNAYDRLQIGDAQVIRGLVDAGSDSEKEHELEYFFYGSDDGLRRLANSLAERGYELRKEPDEETEAMMLVIRLPLDLGLIVGESIANHDAAEDAGVELDGWGAAVVP